MLAQLNLTLILHRMLDPKELANWSAALLTPVISIVTAIILIYQYRLSRQRWRLDLFEKRHAVYRAAADYVASILRHGTTSSEAQAAFLTGTRDRAFLFGPEVPALLHEIWCKSIDLDTHQHIFRDMPIGPDRTSHVEAAGELKKQMPAFLDRLESVFGAYLSLREK